MNPVIRNIFWLLAEHGSRIILSTLSVSLMARALGVEQYGLLQYTLGLVAAFSSISFLCGADVLVPRLVSASDSDRKKLLGNAFVLRAAASLLAYCCLLFFSWQTEKKSSFSLIALAGVIIFLGEPFAVVNAWLQSQTAMKSRVVLQIPIMVAKSILIAALYKSNSANIFYFASIYTFEYILSAAGLFFLYWSKNKDTWFCFDANYCINLFKKSFPFWIGWVVVFAFQKIDLIILRQFSDDYHLGIYSAASQLILPIIGIAPIISSSVAPKYVFSEKDDKLVKKNIYFIMFLMFSLALAICFFVQICSGFILHALFGQKFSASIPLLKNMAWLSVLIFVDSSLSLYLLNKGMSIVIFFKWLTALLVAGVANILLVQKYHLYGVIYGNAIGYIYICLFDFAFFLRNNATSNK